MNYFIVSFSVFGVDRKRASMSIFLKQLVLLMCTSAVNGRIKSHKGRGFLVTAMKVIKKDKGGMEALWSSC